MTALDDSDMRELSAILGAPIAAAERCRWGFENRTAIVTLADGQQRVVQRISSRAQASQKIHLARSLPERLVAAGIRSPRLLQADAAAEPPYVVREYLPGDPAASLMNTIDGAVQVAGAMGALLPHLASVDASGVALGDAWAVPARLAQQATQQLDRHRAQLDAATISALAAAIAALPAHFAGRPAAFAHGDFCPVNALVGGWGMGARGQGSGVRGQGSEDYSALSPQPSALSPQPSTAETQNSKLKTQNFAVVALLDLEFARIADPLFDAAWWGWVVRYHHYERWLHAWPVLLAAAGIPHDRATAERVRIIQLLRCLEMIDDHAAHPPEVLAMWHSRLRDTVGWE